jgi:membrane protease YdiL (CAAX protease family)
MLAKVRGSHSLILLGVVALIIGLLAYRLILEGLTGLTLVGGLTSFAVFLFWYLWLGLPTSKAQLNSLITQDPRRAWLIPLGSAVLYGFYCLVTGHWEALSYQPVLFFFAPFFVAILFPTTVQQLSWQDLVIILLIWIPIDARWVQPAWPWPEGMGGNAFTITSAVPLLASLMLVLRRLEGVKYLWTLERQDWRPIAVNFTIFLAIAIPIGLATGFIKWSGLQLKPEILFTFIITFLWVAVPEELMFRGVIQNLLQKTWTTRPQLAMWSASIIFGLSHLNNGNQPDWRYAALATIAGYLYGRTFNQCRSFVPAVIVHTLVDTVWIHFFRG